MTKPKKTIHYKDRAITVYSIGWLALLVNRTVTQVRRWEKAKILPPPLLDAHDNRRWYTAGELHGYSRVFKASNVRTGMKIENTPFKIKAAQFRMNFRKVLEGPAKDIVAKLPEEEAIIAAFSDNREAQVRDEARRITDGIV